MSRIPPRKYDEKDNRLKDTRLPHEDFGRGEGSDTKKKWKNMVEGPD